MPPSLPFRKCKLASQARYKCAHLAHCRWWSLASRHRRPRLSMPYPSPRRTCVSKQGKHCASLSHAASRRAACRTLLCAHIGIVSLQRAIGKRHMPNTVRNACPHPIPLCMYMCFASTHGPTGQAAAQCNQSHCPLRQMQGRHNGTCNPRSRAPDPDCSRYRKGVNALHSAQARPALNPSPTSSSDKERCMGDPLSP